MDFYKEFMVNFNQYISLCHNSFNLVLLLDIFLLHRFQSIKTPCLFLSHQGHFSKGTLPDHRHKLKLLQVRMLALHGPKLN